ncbi:MAG: hypothetical protein ACRDD3_01895 [Azovibrio sp.]
MKTAMQKWVLPLLVYLLCSAFGSSNANQLGFPPQKTCSFLASIPGMALPSGNTYSSLFGEDDYLCGTRYKEIGVTSSAVLPNNISYYVRGTPNLAKRLRILLNVNQPNLDKEGRIALTEAAQTLFQSAFGIAMPDKITESVIKGTPGAWKHAGYAIELKKEIWSTGRGHELNFIIRDPAFVENH